MNDVGGSGGTGLRAGKTSRTSDANFEYDDSEWDVGIGNLIIDLDKDIEKNNEATQGNNSGATNNSVASNSASNSNSPVHSPRQTSLTPPTTQMHIPPTSGPSGNTSSSSASSNSSSNTNASSNKGKSTSNSAPTFPNTKTAVGAVGPSGELSGKSMEHSAVVDKGLKMKIKRTKTGTKSGADEKHEIVKTDLNTSASASSLSSGTNSINNIGGSCIMTNSKNSGNSGGGNSSGASLSDSISSKSAHSSKIKDGSMIMIDADSIVGGISNHGVAVASTNNGINKDASSVSAAATSITGNGEHVKSTKTPRKGKEQQHKKVKSNNNNGNSNKKDEQRNTNNSTSSDLKNNSISSHTNAKDGKDYFSTTVSLNVPTIVPNASSAFSKTTLKVPNSISSNAQNSIQLHSTTAIDPTARNHNHSLSNTSSWNTAASPSKEKSLNSSQSLSGFGKKVRAIGTGDKSSKEDGLSGCTALSAIASSYRNSVDNISSSISATVNHTGPSGSSPQGGRNSQSGASQDMCIGTSVGTVTDPDCLGPCEPGTAVTLEGIVWHENENGILVVNVTWRGKTYVGTLIDCTKNDWAPPRFCDSPTSDLEMRTPKNRAKRGRGQAATPVNEVQSDLRIANVKLRNGAKGGRRGSATNFVAPASPLKSGDQWPKRKTRGSENESQDEPSGGKSTKKLKVSKEERNKSSSPVPLSDLEKSSGPSSPALIECPEPNCSKKYKHINGLRYHQSHCHNNFAEDSDSNASTTSTQLATPTDAVDRPGSEPMAIDSICDLDGDASPIAVDESSAILKRSGSSNGGLKLDDILDENASLGDKESGELQDLSLSLCGKSSNKNGKGTKESLSEADSKSFESLSKDTNSSSIPPRPAILTVPSFISIQNRSVVHGHSLLSSRDSDNTVMKPTPISIGNSPMLQKGIPWQPHVHNPVSSSHLHHSPSSAAVTLNIPGDKISSTKDRFSESHGKKNKHKKKSKDKDKDGKSKSVSKSVKSNSKNGGGRSKFSNLSASEGSEGRGSIPDDLRIPNRTRDEHNFSDSNAGPAGENRDDPQSPAYSDISDANDSGDADLNVGVVVKDGKSIGNPELKKDAPTIPVAPYFSPFYTPYMEPKIVDKPVGISHEETEKLKAKSTHMQNLPPGPLPQPSSNPDDNGRSPKMDFPHPKYLPHQYYSYPYSNYHYEPGQFNNVMSDNSFNSPRGFISDEREKEKEISGDLIKHKHSERDGVNIKTEPGIFKDGRPSNLPKQDDKYCGSEIKSEFGSDYAEPPKSMPHYMQTCSKHSKDKRDDMNKGDQFRGGPPSDKSKDDIDKESKEKEKNEGVKPTMETTGPPPPPTQGSYAYIPQPYLQPGSPFGQMGLPFDPGHPLYRQVLVPGPYGGSPFMHPGPIPRYPPPSGATPLPEDLSRPPNVPLNASGTAAKALDLLQHHAQYYQVHKIHELSERALKSPSPQVGQRGDVRGDPPLGVPPSNMPTSPAPGPPGGRNSGNSVGLSGNPNVSNNKVADLSKEPMKLGGPPGGLINESSRSPPTQHHVHTHHHTHAHVGVGIGYPIIPAFNAPHSPHYGVPPSAAPPVIPPYPSQKPT